jgi:hypothetical protein
LVLGHRELIISVTGLVGTAGLSGMLVIWRIYAPGTSAVFAFWAGLAAMAVLAAFPRPRVSVAANVLVALGSIFLNPGA